MSIETELAWAAGFFDGEGHVGAHPNGKGKRLHAIHAEVTQIRQEELVRFVCAVGTGKVYGPYDQGPNRQPQYRWRISGFEKVQHLAAVLWPYLCSNKREAFTRALTIYREERG